jgi:hypothetical protein
MPANKPKSKPAKTTRKSSQKPAKPVKRSVPARKAPGPANAVALEAAPSKSTSSASKQSVVLKMLHEPKGATSLGWSRRSSS